MEKQSIQLNGKDLSLEQFEQVVRNGVAVQLHPNAIIAMNRSRQLVMQWHQEGRRIYGITTGFGKFSDQIISSAETDQLQINLIRSHACGVGNPFPTEVVRGMMLLRAQALAQGFSGIRVEVVQLLLQMLNLRIHPIIPSQGSLGASGDLVPLAHMVLPMLGEGQVEWQGTLYAAKDALEQNQLQPIQLQAKEGLALINGTQTMTSLGALAVLDGERAIHTANLIASLTIEALRGIPAAYHPFVGHSRPHPGQRWVAEQLLQYLKESERITQPGELRTQDAYSLRCIPQVHGASWDALQHVKQVIQIELNSVTDNPLIDPFEEQAISAGNFHGQPVGLALDYLAIALAELGNISERRTERMVNPQLSQLPAFLTDHGGLHSGLMIPQYVAAALVAENKLLASPATVDSIPSSANQEDHVSMGTTAARKLYRLLDNLWHILAIEYLVACQAIDFQTGQLGKGSSRAYEQLRAQIPFVEKDRVLSQDMKEIAQMIRSRHFLKKIGIIE
ncbi:histidine ammonia-lyase [Rubeoparvulum massiliense]|uniref:histidine ammonia-lyase n=1 Tax=Rubeoparvulum massiliense TaxID=1631346 RepID=UPI00065DFCF9|nr:histidine ammonia-lyase [Rubeoparvulum massiliense]